MSRKRSEGSEEVAELVSVHLTFLGGKVDVQYTGMWNARRIEVARRAMIKALKPYKLMLGQEMKDEKRETGDD